MKRLITLLLMCMCVACTETGQSTPQYYDLSPAELGNLQRGASLDGSGSAALRLGQYYKMSKNDKVEALHWYKLSAEAGNTQGMYEYSFLLEMDGRQESRKQARYWLEKAKAQGEPLAVEHLERMDKGI